MRVLRDNVLWPDWLGWAAAGVAILTALRLGSVFTTMPGGGSG